MINHYDLPKTSRTVLPVGFGSGGVEGLGHVAERLQKLRRRRALLEAYFSPVVCCGALPSTADRLVLWRSRHGRHHD